LISIEVIVLDPKLVSSPEIVNGAFPRIKYGKVVTATPAASTAL